MKIRSNHFKKQYDLSKAELIGEGNFAQDKVYRIFDPDLNQSLAIRRVKKTESDMDDINKEKVINDQLRKVENQNILKIYDIIDTEEAVWYITQYCSGGSLWDVLNMCKDNKMNEKQCLECVLQISKGVQELHNHRITHRDLKPQNILLKTKYTQNKALPVVKLADFGLSTQKIIMETIAGTKQYIAPQQAKFHNYTNAVDVWSLGIICDEILHGTPFYSGQNNKEVFNKILKLPYRVRDESIRVSIKNFLTSLLKKKPYERPIIAVIRKTIEKILEQIESEFTTVKNQAPKKKQSKDESFQSSTHSSNLNKYSNMLGIQSRKIDPKKIVENVVKEGPKQVIKEVKSPLKQTTVFKQTKETKEVKQPQAPVIPSKKQTIYIPPSPVNTNAIKSSREETKKQEPKKQQQTKRQISGKKLETAHLNSSVERPKQNSAFKGKESRAESITHEKEFSSSKQTSKVHSNKVVDDQKSSHKTELSSESKNDPSSLTKNVQSFQIPIYKMEKKKLPIPAQPKKEALKCEQMEVSEYIRRLQQSKRQLQTVTSQIRQQKPSSFLPNTSFTSQEFTVSVSQSTEVITEFKKQNDLLNYIQYNDQYDVNVYRKTIEMEKNKKKSHQALKKIAQQLKQQFMKQVDTYVEGYVEKLLK